MRGFSPDRGRAPSLAQQQRVRWFAGPLWNAITGLLASTRRRWHVPGDSPDEARQLTGDRGSDDIGWLAAASDLAIAGAQPQLRLPGDLADRPGLLFLSEPQLTADPGW